MAFFQKGATGKCQGFSSGTAAASSGGESCIWKKPSMAFFHEWLAVLLCLMGVGLGRCCPNAAADEPTAAVSLKDSWRQAAPPLIADARQTCEQLARLIERWPLPDESAAFDRQVIVTIAADLSAPVWLPAAAEPVWQRFVYLRRQRADLLFQQAVAALERPSSSEKPASATEAMRLLTRVLRENPDHAQARAGLGYVENDGQWTWPNVARHLDRGKIYSATEGWLSRGQQQGRTAQSLQADANSPLPLSQALTFASDHWEIRSTAELPAAAELARRLEQTRLVWLQAFGGFAVEPTELKQRLSGHRKPRPSSSFAAVLLANRQQYIDELQRLEPRIAQTLGIYWTPTKTAWFFQGDEPPARTIEHEATHQLFAESRWTNRLAGEQCGMWALEAVACYMESLEPTAFGYSLGGRNAGRVPAARERLFEDGFFVPLQELCELGRLDLQRDPRLPQIYSQIAGLADFFLNGEEARFRDAFIDYLRLIYRGTAQPDSLWKLCNRSPGQLDEAYHNHLAEP
jgi:hypothetical protein